MATVTVERGEASYRVWQFLTDRGIPFKSYRNFGTNPPTYYQEWLSFDVDSEALAVELALRFSGLSSRVPL